MTPTQEVLLSWAADRLRAAGAAPGGDAGGDGLSAVARLRAAREALAVAGGHAAVCVLADLDVPSWMAEVFRFAVKVPAEDGEAWRRALTRTVFLSGRPANLRERFAFSHTSADGSAAWFGPAPAAAGATLRRLLKTFEGTRPFEGLPEGAVLRLGSGEDGTAAPVGTGTVRLPGAVQSPGRMTPVPEPIAFTPAPPSLVPGQTSSLPPPLSCVPGRSAHVPGSVPPLPAPARRPPVHRELYAATAGVTLAAALVHLHHLLVEAVADDLLAPGDRLTLRSAPRLSTVTRPVAALRADTDALHPDQLQAYALLTEEI